MIASKSPARHSLWTRIFAGALTWAAAYNLIWVLAWFVFMRRQWLAALAESRHTLPWHEIWIVWIALTVPLGAAVMAYVAHPSRAGAPTRAALAASLTLWIPITTGKVGWGISQSLSLGIVALDAIVNLIALGGASLAGARTLQRFDRQWPSAHG